MSRYVFVCLIFSRGEVFNLEIELIKKKTFFNFIYCSRINVFMTTQMWKKNSFRSWVTRSLMGIRKQRRRDLSGLTNMAFGSLSCQILEFLYARDFDRIYHTQNLLAFR